MGDGGGTVWPPTTSGLLLDPDDGALALPLGCDDGAVTEPVGCGVDGSEPEEAGVDGAAGVDGFELGADDGFELGAEVAVPLGAEVGPPMLIPMIGPSLEDGLDEGVEVVAPASATLLSPVAASWFVVPPDPVGLNTPFTVVPSQVSGSHQVTVELGLGVAADVVDDGELGLAAEPELAGALAGGGVVPVGAGAPVGVGVTGAVDVGFWVGAPAGGADAEDVAPAVGCPPAGLGSRLVLPEAEDD
ncbi:MAG: hypothetical protein HOW97_12540, partial [Catenulispora sp.]|nr:hypothetical protein [Catenulispora sp.]